MIESLLRKLEEVYLDAQLAIYSRTERGKAVTCALGFIKPECLSKAGKAYLEVALREMGPEAQDMYKKMHDLDVQEEDSDYGEEEPG